MCRLSVELPSLWAGPVCQCVACLNWLEQWFERVRGGRVGGGGGGNRGKSTLRHCWLVESV